MLGVPRIVNGFQELGIAMWSADIFGWASITRQCTVKA